MLNRKRKSYAIIAGFIAAILIIGAGIVYSHYGGFSTGKCADTGEFLKYAESVSDFHVPDGTRIVALGEASHGNKEFQQLRLDIFRILVDQYGVRAFALEGDCGGCELVNRYIHGDKGNVEDALSSIGFAIYRTDEMKNLVEWMRVYNASAQPGEDLQFYGFDMQQYNCSYHCLLYLLQNMGIDTAELDRMWNSEKDAYKDDYTSDQRAEIIREVKEKLPSNEVQAIHYAEILLQNIELGKYINDSSELNEQRDHMMAENVIWISRQEQERGNNCIMISGHNNHVMRCRNSDSSVLGSLLAEEFEDAYFSVGTDFYRSVCNLPKSDTGERITHTFFSCDPLAKASKKCGLDVSFLDFSKVSEESALTEYIDSSIQMGSLGESYSMLMNFIPKSYRVSRSPRQAYDAMIFVANATPTEIWPLAKNTE